MPEDLQDLMNQWKNGPFAELVLTLKEKISEKSLATIEDFCLAATELASRASEQFVKIFDLQSIRDIDPKLKLPFITAIVSCFNSVIPADYPYILALVFSDASPDVRFSVMARKSLPGAHDIISKNILPIIYFGDQTDLDKERAPKLNITDVQYL